MPPIQPLAIQRRPKPRTTISALLAALKACSNSRNLESGRRVHADATESGYETNMFVASALINMYSKCSDLLEACRVFDKMLCHDLVAWSSMILAYAENGQETLALELFSGLRITPNAHVYVAALKACTSLAAKEEPGEVCRRGVKLDALSLAMDLHSQAVKSACRLDVFVTNTLIDLYSKCGSMLDAREVFDRAPIHSIVTWTALMLGYTENGEESVALELFHSMQALEPDSLAFVTVLGTCGSLAMKEEASRVLFGNTHKPVKLRSLEKGMRIHSQAAKLGYHSDEAVANGLVDVYSKCGSMEDARRVFDLIPEPSAVTWTSLLFGYTRAGEEDLALGLFEAQKKTCSWRPDARCFVAVLEACRSSAALSKGKLIQSDVCKLGLEHELPILSSLVDLYGRCGSLLEAQLVFDSTPRPDPILWSSLMAGYSRDGDADRVFQILKEMRGEGAKLDGITFMSVLFACNHAGLVDKGLAWFRDMEVRFGLSPEIEHYHCVVDMLSRANRLEEAVGIVRRTEIRFGHQTAVGWGSVLFGCKKWRNVELGRVAFRALLKLRGRDRSGCKIMSDILTEELLASR